MNFKDLTMQQISVMRAFAFEGRRIQCRRNYKPDDEWRDVIGVPQWNWAECVYRVKEEPRTCYVAFRNDDGVPSYCLAEDMYLRKKAFYDKTMHFTYVKMQELGE